MMASDPSKRRAMQVLSLAQQLMNPYDCWLSVAMSLEFSHEVLNPDFYKYFCPIPLTPNPGPTHNICFNFFEPFFFLIKILCRSNKIHLEVGFVPEAPSFQLLN